MITSIVTSNGISVKQSFERGMIQYFVFEMEKLEDESKETIMKNRSNCHRKISAGDHLLVVLGGASDLAFHFMDPLPLQKMKHTPQWAHTQWAHT
jgi:hypothetical protein